jgi:hypothetical protein
MSTLQHTLQPAFRNRLALMVVLAGAIAALTVTLIVATGSSSSLGSRSAPSFAESQRAQRQLQAVSGARFGIRPPVAPATAAKVRISPQHQLQAVAGARYRQPVGIQASH